MLKRWQGVSVAVACALAAQVVMSISSGEAESTLTLGQCAEHLQTFVSQLQEKARQEGTAILVEWKADGSVVLRYEHFAQRMRCQKGVLLVDYPGFNP